MKQGQKLSGIEISVIIVNYNVRDFLQQSLISIKKALKGIRSEIFVVDNASDDGSAEMVRKRFPGIRLIRNSINLGFAKANNLAIKQAKGRFLLLINPDTVVQEDTIRVMLEFMKSHPDSGLAGCKILNPDGSFEPACRRSFPTPWVAFTKVAGLSKLFPRAELFGKYNITYLSAEETYPVDAVSGSFMMVRNEALKVVGGLDESFFMYGEDLDWCYRIRKAGWQIYYVHSTQIIHYKGESTRRSNIDEISTFYNAMHLFVEKHFRYSAIFTFVLRSSIVLASVIAFITSSLRPLKIAFFDFMAVTISLLIAEEIRRGGLFRYPAYAYPIVFTIPALIVITSLYIAGVYTHRRMSISRSIVTTSIAYVIISALTAFFKDYAFSRMIMAISGIFSITFIAGWRIVYRILGKSKAYGRGSLFGKRTIIVGTNKDAADLHKKLRTRVGEGYDVVGFIGTTHKSIGDKFNGVSIIGSIDNIGKVIREQKVNDVIFAPEALTYSQILTVISKCKEQSAAFHLVPTTMEVIVGKANVHNLEDVPLVQINYNIRKPFNIITKRIFDIVLSGLLILIIYPVNKTAALIAGRRSGKFISGLPKVFSGKMTMVGSSTETRRKTAKHRNSLFFGKPGLCSLLLLQNIDELSNDEIDQYDLYYARSQSVLLDIEILIKAWLKYREKKSKV